jgi:flagellar motor protein MotB
MRNFIIGLSILFFVLSGLIVLKALDLPVYNSRFQNTSVEQKPEAISPEVKETLEQFTEEQAASRAMVEELQATITTLEDKLSEKKEEAPVNVKTEEPAEKPRTLAVIGNGIFLAGKGINEKHMINAVSKIVQEIMEHPDHQVRVEGHTSTIHIKPSTGQRYIANLNLSIFRAEAVAQMLVKKGISRERITVTGYGDTRPVASNETYEGRVKNRRVEVKLVPGDKEF